MSWKFFGPWILLLAGAHLFLGFQAIRHAAPAYDESSHLASGYTYWAHGRYLLNNLYHPPLARLAAALPLLALKPLHFSHHPYWTSLRQYPYAHLFLYENRYPAEKMLHLARGFQFVLWTLVLGSFLFLWTRRVAGPLAAGAALFFHAFSPNILGYGTLITTDFAPTVLFFTHFYCLYRFNENSSKKWSWAGAAAILAGLALGSKFSMAILLPMGVLFFAVLRQWKFLPLYLALALLSLAGLYRFTDFSLYWQGLGYLAGDLERGRSSFLLGNHSTTGWWYYFPVAILVKTPLSLLLSASLGAAICVAGTGREAGGLPRAGTRFQKLILFLPPLLYLLAACSSKVQIGVRHVLPIYPYLFLCAGVGVAALWSHRRYALLVPLLCSWQGISLFRAHPYPLTHFNELAGGPSGGYRILTDSNLDWGQGLQALGDYLRERGSPSILLSYFGTADPHHYGIRYLPTLCVTNIELPGNLPASQKMPELLAVSATNLQGTYYADKGIWEWLRERRPLFRAAHSIFLYDLSRDPEGLKRVGRLLGDFHGGTQRN
ncbi:MAG: glycosyltransferase family 39 protein [Elusimicrobia bacterium]|nr:glycosyltransferase family 39 protein [Elusimicrobiota bacterium]